MEATRVEVTVGEPFVGEIRQLLGATVPDGWIPCDGRLLAVDLHPVLFDVIGNGFGGDGESTFVVPALTGTHPPAGRFIICSAIVGAAERACTLVRQP